MPPDTEDLIIARLDRIEDKLDGVLCEQHHSAIWNAINKLRWLFGVGVGIAIASSVLLPILLTR